jgi:hypothetical protein
MRPRRRNCWQTGTTTARLTGAKIERFQTRIKRAKVLGLHSTEHGTFVFEENQQTILIRDMNQFLNEASR